MYREKVILTVTENKSKSNIQMLDFFNAQSGFSGLIIAPILKVRKASLCEFVFLNSFINAVILQIGLLNRKTLKVTATIRYMHSTACQ